MSRLRYLVRQTEVTDISERIAICSVVYPESRVARSPDSEPSESISLGTVCRRGLEDPTTWILF
jgi:hypothetical protein